MSEAAAVENVEVPQAPPPPAPETSEAPAETAPAAASPTETTSEASPTETPQETAAVAPEAEIELTIDTPKEEAPKEEPALSADDFNWMEWDGKSDGLPEDVRSWASKIGEHHEKAYSTLNEEVATIRGLYEHMLESNEDPRVKELTESNTTIKAELDELKNTHELYLKEVEKQYVEQAEVQLQNYLSKNTHILEDEATYDKFASFIKEGWGLNDVGSLMKLSEEAVALAAKARGEGTPDKYAVQLAQSKYPVKEAPKPRPAAVLTAGATTGRSNPNLATKSMGDATSFTDLRNMAIKKSINSGRK